MWSLRILSGPQAGQIIQLKDGENIVGRAEDCDVPLDNPGVSKRHAKLIIRNHNITVLDLNSSNGTFVNGVRIRQKEIAPTDKIGFFDVLVDVQGAALQSAHAATGTDGIIQSGTGLHAVANRELTGEPPGKPEDFPDKVKHYVENVALPGVYKLLEIGEYKTVLGLFVLAFVILFSVLSFVPFLKIAKENVEKEAQNRVRTITKALALANQTALSKGWDSTLDTSIATRENGVKAAFIINSADGSIIAPPSKRGEYPNEPFINRARRKDRAYSEQINDSLVGASIPITSYDPAVGERRVRAHAIVLYDLGALSIDSERATSLFVQTLAIGIALGILLFYLLLRISQFPIEDLNRQLDHVLKSNGENVETAFQIPALKTLALNINSALNRNVGGGGIDGADFGAGQTQDRTSEASNLVQIIPVPAMAVNKNKTIIFVNTHFEELTGIRLASVQGQSMDAVGDQALGLSLSDLLDRNSAEPHLIATNQLDFGGTDYELDSQAILGKEDVEYFIMIFKPVGDQIL